VAVTALLFTAAIPAFASEPLAVARPGKPILDPAGNALYIIDLVEPDEAKIENAPLARVRSVHDAIDFKKEKSRGLVDDVVKQINAKAISTTALVGTSFSAYLSEKVVENLRRDKRVKRITQDTEVLPSSLWQNSQNGGQTRSWGHAAIGAEFVGNSNGVATVYVIDNGIGWHSDLNVSERVAVMSGVNPIGCDGHSTHVAGIIGAYNNSYGTIGIRPGVRMVSVSLATGNVGACGDFNSSGSAIVAAFEFVRQRVWSSGIAGVVNLSYNGNVFDANGTVGQKMLQVATPMDYWNTPDYPGALVVQSAGNSYQNACNFSYNGTQNSEGILVVGGLDWNGQPVAPLGGIGASGFVEGNPSQELGSNFGPCVEVWGPSNRIVSTWNDGGIRVLSGTSMAAPHVTGLAAAILEANPSFSPQQLEAQIRSGATHIAGSWLNMPRAYFASFVSKPTVEISNFYQFNQVYATITPSNAQNPAFIAPASDTSLGAGSVGASSCQLLRNGVVQPDGNLYSNNVQRVIVTNGLSPGTYTWQITCWDAYGNSSSANMTGVLS
jgi:subtilisin family serine protease